MANIRKKQRGRKKDPFCESCVKGDFEELLAAIEEANETKHFTWPYNNQPLHFAAAYGNLEVVRALIEKYNYDAECKNAERVTPLHLACLGGHSHVVEYLLTEKQCNPNVLDVKKASPLHYVCWGTYDMLEKTPQHVKKYYVVNSKYGKWYMVYSKMLAVFNTNVLLVQSVEQMYYNSAMRLHYSRGHINITRNLLLHKCDPFVTNSLGQQPMLLELACQCGSVEDLRYFTETVPVDGKTNLESLLCIACNYERVETIQFLSENYIDHGTELPKCDSIFLVGCLTGNLATVKCIIEHNIIVSVTVKSLIDAANHRANYTILKYLLVMHNSTTDHTNSSDTFQLLDASLKSNNFELMRAIVDENTITIRDSDGNTPLHWICRYNNLQFVDYLLKHVSADDGRNVPNNDGQLPLHIACKNSVPDLDVIKLVAPSHDHINTRDCNDNTALHVACMNEEVMAELIQYLVEELGINPCCQNSKKQNTLHLVAKHYGDHWYHSHDSAPSLLEIAKIVSKDPTFNVNAQDKDGDTPLHIASRKKCFELIQYLIIDKQCDQSIQNNDNQLPLNIILGRLYYTSTSDMEKIVEAAKLVSSQANLNINAQDEDGNTPLHIACKHKNFELIRYLTQELRCNQNIQNCHDCLPLHIILEEMGTGNDHDMSMYLEVVRQVSSQSLLNIHAQNQNGNTPLHLACKFEVKDIVKYLVFEKNCKPIEHPDNYSSLNIHVACAESDDISLLRLLATRDNVNNERHYNIIGRDWRSMPLHVACESENLAAIKILLQLGSNLNASNNKQELPLHIACRKGSLKIVELVADCDENFDDQPESPLHIACSLNHTEIVKFFFENKHCNHNIQTRYYGDTILHSACRNGAIDVVQYLFKGGYCNSMSVIQNKRKHYPVHMACTKSLELVKMTSQNFTTEQLMTKTAEEFNCLHLASSHGLVDVVEYLIEQGCSPTTEDGYGINALGSACGLREYSLTPSNIQFQIDYFLNQFESSTDSRVYNERIHLDVVRYLVAKCDLLDPTKPQGKHNGGYFTITPQPMCTSLFEHACKLQNLELMKALLEASKVNNTDELGNTPLHIACKFGQLDMVDYLVQQGCDQTIQNRYLELALHLASSQSVEMVKLLDLSRIDINTQCSSGDTPLHIACRSDKEHIASLLLQQGCDQTIQNHDLELALHLASSQSVEMVKLLDLSRIDINTQCSSGDTPLHIACRSDKEHIVSLLLQQGSCNTSIPNKTNGDLPIHIACTSKSAAILRCLVKADQSNILVKNKKGKLPIHIASELGNLCHLAVLSDPNNINEPDLDGNSALHLACLGFISLRDLAMTLWLVEHGAKTDAQNSNGDTPAHVCIKYFNDVKNVDKVITSSSTLIANNDGDLLIHLACRKKMVDLVVHLSHMDTFQDSLQFKNEQGDTPLHIAIKVWASNQILNLVATPANCNAQNKLGNAPLHLICMSKNFLYQRFSIFKRHLFELGCDIHLVNNSGQLPLHIAAMHSGTSLSFFRMLLDRIEMVTCQDNDNNTPLHLSCYKHENKKITEYLLARTKDYLRNEQPLAASVIFDSVINLNNTDGNTPLQLAIQTSDENLVQCIANCKHCNLSKQNSIFGYTALHLACSKSSFEVVKLVFSVDSFVQTDSPKDNDLIFTGDTPLHIACRRGDESIVNYLINKGGNSAKAVMVVPNARKELPIHLCCSRLLESHDPSDYLYESSHSESLLKLLMKFNKKLNFANSQTIDKETVLHIACKHPYCSPGTLSYLLKTMHCAVNILNCDGDLPLHLLCRNTRSTFNNCRLLSNLKLLVSALQSESKSAICAQNSLGNTPLHEVCQRNSYYEDHAEEMEEIVKYLLEQGCDEKLSNNDHETALLLACRYKTLSVVKLFSLDNVLGVSKEGNTVLHYACLNQGAGEYKSSLPYNIVDYLINKSSEPQLLTETENNDKETPLHLACKINNLALVKLLIAKQHAGVCRADIRGQTPITLTTNPTIINVLLEHGADPAPLYELHKRFFQRYKSTAAPPPVPLKILVIGDSGAGKTTLVQSLKRESGENVPQTDSFGHTAGVVPSDFSSQIYGEVTMYDFAGHSEYYSSHGGVIHSIIKNSPPVILVLVNLTRSRDEIKDRALYWTKFVLNYCASLEGKPHLIIVGSHADVLKRKNKNPSSKIITLLKVMEDKFKTKPLVVRSALTMDCTQSQSSEIDKLRKELESSSNELRDKTVLQFSSHCLYVFLEQKFHPKPAIALHNLLSKISENSYKMRGGYESTRFFSSLDDYTGFFPTEATAVSRMCEELSERGHVLYIKHPQASQITQSWIVLKRDVLLHDVIGCLFAPPDFPQHISLANSTGVVPISKLKPLPHDPSILTGFLTQMEYCQEILDPETLQLLEKDKNECLDSLDEKYFFFPSLVRVERPPELWKSKPSFTNHCGVILECEEPEDYFNPQFIQVLLLRLAFSYAVKPTRKNKKGESSSSVHGMVEKRVCTVWKSGIHWLDRSGIEVLVDVIDNNKILILMQCLDHLNIKIKCSKCRSSVLSTITTLKKQLCPGLEIAQHVLHPGSIQHPLPPMSDVSYFTMDDINRTIQDNEPMIINDDKHFVQMNELLFFEPYALLCNTIVDRLFGCDSSNLELMVSDDFLYHMCHHLLPCYDHVVELIKPTTQSQMGASASRHSSKSADKLFQLFKKWQRHQPQDCGSTYLKLRDLLNEVSLFPALGLTPKGVRLGCIFIEENCEQEEGYLRIGDLKKVQRAIWEMRAKWKNLGIQLLLDPSLLDVIKEDCHDTDERFNKMLEAWLEREDPRPTWSELVEAIKSSVVDNPQLAQKLEEEHVI